MTQQYLGQIPDPAQESGTDLAARLNAFDNAHRTNQSGPTRPANILAGGFWTRVVAGVYEVVLFDGAQDHVLLRGSSNLAGLTNIAQARANIQAIGTGVSGQLLPLPVNDLDAQNTLPTGVFSVTNTTVGRPAGVSWGTVYISRRTAGGGETQLVVSDTPELLMFARSRGAAGWTSWSEIIHGASEAEARSKIGITANQSAINRLNAASAYNSAAWIAGTETVGGLPSPKQIADAIAALAPAYGASKQWYDVRSQRSSGTVYQNTSGDLMFVHVARDGNASHRMEVSNDGTTWLNFTTFINQQNATFPVQNGAYYRTSGTTGIASWLEFI